MEAIHSGNTLVGGGSNNTSGTTENEFEKLSREIHQMQLTGAIHKEWLEHPQGYLLKPDFKRRAQQFGAGGKKLQAGVRGLHFRLPGATYKPRWFQLDGMNLRYFKTHHDEQEVGSIHLASVNAVLPSKVADAPEHALDLVCADRIYTIAGNNREDMVRWATVLTQVLRGSYHTNPIVRREPSTRVSHLSMRGSYKEEGESVKNPPDVPIPEGVKEKAITVTFEEPGKLHLHLQATIDDKVSVSGFSEPPEGGVGLAEACGAIHVGDILIGVNEHSFWNIRFEEVISYIRMAERPLYLRFVRMENTYHEETRVAEGWVLAKEPGATRYRLRMLQLSASELSLYKPALHSGRQEFPCTSMSMNSITDIRITHDKRSQPDGSFNFCSKQWGITLESLNEVFTVYLSSQDDMNKWINLLRNSRRTQGVLTLPPIPIHPLAVVERQEYSNNQIILEGEFLKLGELTQHFNKRYFRLLSSGKLCYFRDKETSKKLGMIRLENLCNIIPLELEDPQQATLWRLNLMIFVTTSTQKYRRNLTMCFDSKKALFKWTRTIEQETKDICGREFDISLTKAKEVLPEVNIRSNGSSQIQQQQAQQLQVQYSSIKMSKGLVAWDMGNLLHLRGWFYGKPFNGIGLEAYHLRYVILKSHQLLIFKYEILGDESLHRPASCIDLHHIKDVREPDANNMDTVEFSMELVTQTNDIHVLVAETFEQKELWLSVLIRFSDVFCSDYNNTRDASSVESILPSTKEKKEAKPMLCGWVDVSLRETNYFRKVYALICDGVFSFYLSQEEYEDEWGDALYAIHLQNLRDVHSESDDERKFSVRLENEESFEVLTPSRSDARNWMLCMCYYGDLVLQPSPKATGWLSSVPKDAWVWKQEPLFHIFRRRYISLRNECLVFKIAPEDRVLGKVELSSICQMMTLKITTTYCKEEDRKVEDRKVEDRKEGVVEPNGYRLFLKTSYLDQTHSRKKVEEQPSYKNFYNHHHHHHQKEDDDVDLFNMYIDGSNDDPFTFHCGFAFEDQGEMEDWARHIYSAAKDIQSSGIQYVEHHLNPEKDYQLKSVPQMFVEESTSKDPCMGSQTRGWLYFRSQSITPIRKQLRYRYFVSWGYELFIFKHEVLLDEESAIRYGTIDCRELKEVRSPTLYCPENTLELEMNDGKIITIVPRDDNEQVMWKKTLEEVRELYSCTKDIPQLVRKAPADELNLKQQIKSVLLHSGTLKHSVQNNMITKHFVLTSSRLVIFALASHVFDEDADALGSISSRSILEILYTKENPCSFRLITKDNEMLLEAENEESCVQWMKMICHTTGKLEMKKNASTGLWESVNRVLAMSHFLASDTSLSSSLSTSTSNEIHGDAGRFAASRKRTSQLIKLRKVNSLE